MKVQFVKIKNIPTVIYGEKTDKVYIFIHGKQGYKEEGEDLAGIVCNKGYQVISIDLPGHGERKAEAKDFLPWKVVPELQSVMKYVRENWSIVSLRANSIGAYFSMLAYYCEPLNNVLFVSPILDMVKLIQDMMIWAGVTERELQETQIIQTAFGETLDWQYYQYTKEKQPINWSHQTNILYAGKDNLTNIQTVNEFVANHGCKLTVMEDGEHWFHTPGQLAVLDKWTEANC